MPAWFIKATQYIHIYVYIYIYVFDEDDCFLEI